MSHRSRISLLTTAVALLVGCAAQAPRPAPATSPAAAPAAPAGQQQQLEEQTVAPGAAPAGQAAPSSESQDLRNNEKAPTSLTTGEKKTKGPAFSNLADAEAALARENQKLVAMYAPPAMGGATRKTGAGSKPSAARGQSSTAPAAAADKESRCATACKAFASLQRAADAVCRLAGEDDARCDHAKKVVTENGRRVAECGCQHE